MLTTHFLEDQFCNQSSSIEQWFSNAIQAHQPPIYGSVDLRYAGFKISPVDMNLFPAGFNNLSENQRQSCIALAKKSLCHSLQTLERILLIPESHTRNAFYWDNVKTLKEILDQAHFDVRIGLLPDETATSSDILSSSGDTVVAEVIERRGDQLILPHFIPDMILLNNDLAEGVPAILKGLKQMILPSTQLGWRSRFKSHYFAYYRTVAHQFAAHFHFDPWLITPYFEYCEGVDFMQQAGLTCLFEIASNLFQKIKAKYDEYHVSHQPFLMIKADQGTYGMAVMTVRDPQELTQLNRKKRTQMSVTKGNQPVKRVIIQEGVYTFETTGADHAVSEPVVYLWGFDVAGGFYRVHQSRGIDENLNSPGMHFKPLPFSPVCTDDKRIYLYNVIAKLSMLAAAKEIKEIC